MNIKKDIKIALLSSIGMTVATVANAAAPTHRPPVMPAVAPASGFSVGVEALYQRPVNSNLHYAILDINNEGGANNLNITEGPLKEVDPDFHWGFRITGSYLFNNTDDVIASYTNINTSDTDDVHKGDASRLWSLLIHLANTPTSNYAKASFKVYLHQGDLLLGRSVNMGRWNLHFGTGLRGVDLESKLKAFYDASGEDKDVLLEKKSDFLGIGPRVSISGVYNLSGGLGIAAEAGGSLLVGKMKITDMQDRPGQTDVDGIVDVYNESTYNNIVPEADAKLGLRYTQKYDKNSSFEVDAGWQVTEYFNARRQLMFIGHWVENISSKRVDNVSEIRVSNIGFQGPYVGLKVKVS